MGVHGSLLWVLSGNSRRVADLLLKDARVFLQNGLYQSVLADTRGTNKDERFASHRRTIERMEVLFGVHIDVILIQLSEIVTYRLVKKH